MSDNDGLVGVLLISQLLEDLHGSDPDRRDPATEELFASMTDCLRSVDEWGVFGAGGGGLTVNLDLFTCLCARHPVFVEPAARLQALVRGKLFGSIVWTAKFGAVWADFRGRSPHFSQFVSALTLRVRTRKADSPTAIVQRTSKRKGRPDPTPQQRRFMTVSASGLSLSIAQHSCCHIC